MSIRLRLAIIVALITAVLVGAGALALSASLGSGIRATLHDSLKDSALRVEADIKSHKIKLSTHGVTPLALDQTVVQVVITSTGRLAYSTEVAGHVSLVGSTTIRRTKTPRYVYHDRSGSTYPDLLLLKPTPIDGGVTLVVGASLDELVRALSQLRTTFEIAGPLLVLLTSLGAWMLASKALDPVERLRVEANHISLSPPGHRLQVPRSHDELERLGDTFNTLLDRVHETISNQNAFIAAASHELRTPLAALTAEMQLAQTPGRSSADISYSLDAATQAIARLTFLTTDLLLLARGDGGQLILHLEEQSLEPVAATSLATISARADSSETVCVLDCHGAVVAPIDSPRLCQALNNLLENALRYAPGGTIKVTLTNHGGWAVIAVQDDGPGFAPDFLDKAFNRFTRGELARSRIDGGSGLGLAIVKMLVESHHGIVTAENVPTGGALLRILLPNHQANPRSRKPQRQHRSQRETV
ncbi:MAG: sensor histidine kinase [Ferrimicrobium sp.]